MEDATAKQGLTRAEAARRLADEGPNELPASNRRGPLAIIAGVITEPMFLLLLACGALYLVLGDLGEALMLLGFVFVIIGITFFQERKTERALEALRDLSSPRALVVRDGERVRIAGREVVRGDLVLLVEGDRVPADAVLLDGLNLSVDESLLTGESVPVRKAPARAEAPAAMGKPGGDDLPFVFSGTLVVRGEGAARVLATGAATELGKIGRALSEVGEEPSPLKTETGRLVRRLAVVGLALCALVVIAYGLTRGDWTHGFLAGLTLAMAMLPEEFPVVLTVFMALGAWRISKRQVLTRRIPAVETLGAATVLCTDKTGTLTQNRMTVVRLVADGADVAVPDGGGPLPEAVHALAEYGMLASHPDPFDPMDRAVHVLADAGLAGTEHLHGDWVLEREYPLCPELLAMSQVWRAPGGGEYVVAAKGAPEAVADLCHLPGAERDALVGQVTALADEGLRLLGVARARFRPADLPPGQHDFAFQWVGLLGFSDPVRPDVPDAVAQCRDAGIRVIMITGDYPGTARNIARQIGMLDTDEVVTGPELDAMDDAELARRVRTCHLFARVVPQQKLRLVQALQANGEVVAMTGDGVNDAPALKAAHIGIAMGRRGTDVAREASALVLLDDDFASIVAACRLGRRIFDNLRKAMAYIFSVHVPIAGLSLVPVLAKWPLILMPVHVVFLELLIDPACSVVFEAEGEETDVMRRPPRRRDESLFGRATVIRALIQGLVVLAVLLGIHQGATWWLHLSIEATRTLTFVGLVAANLGLIVANRSRTRSLWQVLRMPNRAQWWVVGGGLAFLVLALAVPGLSGMFGFGPVSTIWIAVALVLGALGGLALAPVHGASKG